jgi:predicted lipoprotein with Yx(FWY)xxD motif
MIAMRTPYRIAVPVAAALVLAACANGSYSAPSATTVSGSARPAASTGKVSVTTGDTALGSVLVDGNRRTLYGLTDDSNGLPTCVDACATVWPPVTVAGATLSPTIDTNVFSVVSRPDGSHQLKAGQWPLYRYAGDAAAGDVKGQGSGGVWFVVDPTGTLRRS